MTAGPWRPVRLETYHARIDDLWSEIEVSKDLEKATGTLIARVEGSIDRVIFKLKLNGETVLSEEAEIVSEGLAKLDVLIKAPELWYPRGYGAQTLYDVSVEILRGNFVLDAMSKRIGLRRGQLIQDDDEIGQSFYFKINNVEIFCAGSCWIPADSFIPRIEESKYKTWLQTMVDGNQIMTRYAKPVLHQSNADFKQSLGRRYL